MSIAIIKKVKFDGARCPFSTFLRLQGDHHCACAQKWRHFSFFSKSFQTKASRGGGGSCLNNFPELPIFSSPIPIIKRQYCIAGNFRQRKISSIATARQFVRNIFSSSAGHRSSAESSLIQLSLFCLSSIFAFMNISDPKLAVCEKFGQELNLVKKLLWRKRRS